MVKVNGRMAEWPNEECPNYYPIDESRGPSFSPRIIDGLYPVYFSVNERYIINTSTELARLDNCI